MDLIDRDELTKKINAEYWYCRHYELGKMVDMITEAPTVDAILNDDNFGFAGYIREKNESGYHVEESWNLELNDEELMCIMCGVIQDIKADERLSKLWMKAMDLADFMMEGETE